MATTLDHVDNLGVSDESLRVHGNELTSLRYLWQGLQFLNDQVARIELHISDSLDPKKRVMMFGNHPVLKGVPQGLVASSFHWYAVSACNYVRLVGWLLHGENTSKAADYVRRVIPEVYVWRNKVGAHFARTNPKSEDSPADLIASVMFPIAFDDDAFWTNRFNIGLTRRGKGSSSRTDMGWSLTKSHEALTRRFNPVQRSDEVQREKVETNG